MKMLFYTLLILPFLIHAEDAKISAKLYKPGSQTLIFTLEGEDHNSVAIRHYRQADGQDAVIETVQLRDGKPLRYIFDQRQMRALGELDVKEDGLELIYISGGLTQTVREALPEHLLIGPLIGAFIKENWKLFQSGESVIASVPVLSKEHLLMANLKFFRDASLEKKADERVIVMKPASWIIALFLDPDYLTLNADGSRLLRINGPTLLKTKVGNDWKNTNCDMIYDPNP